MDEGAVVEDPALVFVLLVVAIEEEVTELVEAETAVKEDVPVNEG